MLALGLTGSFVAGAGGCATQEPIELCANSEVDYGTCMLPTDPEPDPEAVYDPDAPRVYVEVVCFDGSDGCDPCDVEAITGAAIEQADNSCTITELQRVTLACGPDPESTDCCYKVRLEGVISCSQVGRPLRIGAQQRPRLATLQAGSAWLADIEGLRTPAPALLERVREHWRESGRFEHASVAAFARVGMQLRALGAPATLQRAALRAMGDEIRHARLCFGLAAAYGAGECEAGPLAIDGCVSSGMDLETALREAIIEGALGEGAAALEALEGARSCEDEVVRAVLEGIAEDEQRHALLAYQTVQWALRAHPERARELVRACLREGLDHAPRPTFAREDADATAGYGLISANRRAWLRHEVWTDIVTPILCRMLEPGAEHARSIATA